MVIQNKYKRFTLSRRVNNQFKQKFPNYKAIAQINFQFFTQFFHSPIVV